MLHMPQASSLLENHTYLCPYYSIIFSSVIVLQVTSLYS
jgi:hypothetical protein